MAFTYGADKTALLLKSGILSIGTWTTPNLIGSGNGVVYNSYFSGYQIGSVMRGTQVVNLPSKYVEARIKTPSQLFRKDPIENDFNIEGEIYELNNDLISTLLHRSTVQNDILAGPTTWQLIFIGSDTNALSSNGYLIQTQDVAARNFEIAMYQGLSTPEGWKINMNGDKYATTPLKVEATPDSTFTTLAQDLKCYGYIARQTA